MEITKETQLKSFDINMLNIKISRQFEAHSNEDPFKDFYKEQLIEDCNSLLKLIESYFKDIPTLNAYEKFSRNMLKNGEWNIEQTLDAVNKYNTHYMTISAFYNNAKNILSHMYPIIVDMSDWGLNKEQKDVVL